MSQIQFNSDGSISCSRCGKTGFESKLKAYGHTGACRDKVIKSNDSKPPATVAKPKPDKKTASLRPPMITKLKKIIAAQDDINLVDFNIPLLNGKPTPKLRDILEENVDDSYYLGKEIIEVMVAQSEFTERMVSIKTPKKEVADDSITLISGPVSIDKVGF